MIVQRKLIEYGRRLREKEYGEKEQSMDRESRGYRSIQELQGPLWIKDLFEWRT